ncbi:4Fe-4S binding protein [Palleronia pelagia]|uniref:4Fe-4S binding domain-containing protein n=1 Tax=Palleronia pelagia TaxID=387096 RepID=A0A1H8DRH6_9RHOB|nr:4Fe-4S binding protein [Palleronia pelagia]SEN09813.1 4Fe-4S binding domain-containing protein [Palleronia pelagia]
MTKTVMLCDCLGSQKLDSDALSRASGLPCSKVHSFLCGDEIGAVEAAMGAGDVVIACAQERPTFEALAEAMEQDAPACIDLRDRAGWSDDPADPTPKQAALLAEALLPIPAPRVMDVESTGTCLVIGDAATALPAAERLARSLAVTCLLTDGAPPPETRDFDTVHGRIRNATGALGGFAVTIDGLAQVIAGGRGPMTMSEPRDGARSECDIIVDLSGATPLFPAHHKREGYFRADPGRPEAVADVIFDAAQMTGTFEQPLHVRLSPELCAHSRAEQTGCTRCLDACPTGAITPAGDHVSIDPMICAGCGACSSLCPSGAVSFDAPPVDSVFRRLSTLAETFRKAGGSAPRLLVHDDAFGAEMIGLLARHGAGLPADVIPFAIPSLNAFGHAEALGALACGFTDVSLLLAPKTERPTAEHEAALARAIGGDAALRLLDVADPDALSEALGAAPQVERKPVLPMGSRRQITRLAAKALHGSETLSLPEGAPYGAVLVDTDACTLCLSCVSLCPSGALGDNPDLPQLLFQEDACLQCGLCANICPEDAITLEPRLNLADSALRQEVLNEEEPFACIECGALFGVKSTVEKITEKLAGKHSMFANPQAARMIQMCDTCRINAQYHSQDNPFAAGERPKPRSTADYYTDRKDH